MDLAHTRFGRGVPLIAMHGGMGLDGTCFLPWFEPLADGADVTVYDQRGHGRSPRPDSWDSVTWDTWVDDVDGLRAHLGHDRFVLLGHSYGSFLAQAYALAHPERLLGLVLVGSAPALDHIGEAMAIAQRRGTGEQFDALVNGFSSPAPDDAFLQAAWNKILPIYFHRFDPKVADEMDRRAVYSAAGFNRGQQLLASFDHRGRLGAIKTPTLLIAGASDWITPPHLGAARLATEIPYAEMIIFERSGHFPFIEETDRFAKVVGDWLGRLGA